MITQWYCIKCGRITKAPIGWLPPYYDDEEGWRRGMLCAPCSAPAARGEGNGHE